MTEITYVASRKHHTAEYSVEEVYDNYYYDYIIKEQIYKKLSFELVIKRERHF